MECNLKLMESNFHVRSGFMSTVLSLANVFVVFVVCFFSQGRTIKTALPERDLRLNQKFMIRKFPVLQ